jgi:hypothetical protein
MNLDPLDKDVTHLIAHCTLSLKGLGHEIEFKYFDKMDTTMSEQEPLLVFEFLR